MNLRWTKLSIVEKKGRFGSAVTIVRILGNFTMIQSYVSFSKVTVADFGASAASDEGVTESDVIFPLQTTQLVNRSASVT
jgi:hypothetical protein